jgi:hypothetical protein
MQEHIGGLTLTVSVLSGLRQYNTQCDHAIVLHMPHLCTLRYAYNVAEIAAGVAYATSLADDIHPTDDYVRTVVDAVAAARRDAGSGIGVTLKSTSDW